MIGYKKAARADPFVNPAVPGIAASKLAAVEPYLDACGAQRIAQVLGGFHVLRRVAQEYCPARIGHGAPIFWFCRVAILTIF
jgi:hypothetical protein